MEIRCTFNRIGRDHSPEPLVISDPQLLVTRTIDADGALVDAHEAIDWNAVAARVVEHVTSRLGSKDPLVEITSASDGTDWRGTITVGMFRSAGEFTLEVTP